MNKLQVIVENVNGVLVTTSNRVAEELGVRHDNLIQKIEEYIEKFTKAEVSALGENTENIAKPESLGFGENLNFTEFYIPSSYKVEGNFKSYKNYLITQKGIAQLIGGYNASVPIAFALNVAYINEFERMRKELQGKRPMTRKMESIRNEITLDNKLTYHGTPILITRQLNKLVGYDISLKLSKVKGRSILRNEKVKELKKENAILSNQLTYTAIYYEKNLKELLQKIKELREFKDKITEYFISNEIETRLQQDSNNIEIALKLLDNITDTAVKERISIGILEKMGY